MLDVTWGGAFLAGLISFVSPCVLPIVPPYRTPVGSYRPTRMHVYWESRKYERSLMPHSIFFRGGYAIHGTYDVKRLGRPASHGCVRLHPANARELFNLVKASGRSNTRVIVQR